MPLSRIIAIGLLALGGDPAYAAAADAAHAGTVTDRLFAALPGSWDGRAIETPVGPVDYAIDFYRCGEAMVAGVAELSVSDHYWQFRRAGGELRLTFLSTFRGNRQPTELVVSSVGGDTIRFHAPELALLTLAVSLAEPHVDVRVFHHHEPHVHIRLTRTDRQVADQGPHGGREKSCKRLDGESRQQGSQEYPHVRVSNVRPVR